MEEEVDGDAEPLMRWHVDETFEADEETDGLVANPLVRVSTGVLAETLEVTCTVVSDVLVTVVTVVLNTIPLLDTEADLEADSGLPVPLVRYVNVLVLSPLLETLLAVGFTLSDREEEPISTAVVTLLVLGGYVCGAYVDELEDLDEDEDGAREAVELGGTGKELGKMVVTPKDGEDDADVFRVHVQMAEDERFAEGKAEEVKKDDAVAKELPELEVHVGEALWEPD
jgi:hypothetical protein